MSDQQLKIQEKKTASAGGETTKNEVCFAPHVDIFETETDVTVIADMPGVTTDGITLSLEENILTLQGQRASHNQTGRAVLEEYESGNYLRRFTVAETIDQKAIDAILTDGVLRVRLPKAAPAQPRKIEVKLG